MQVIFACLSTLAFAAPLYSQPQRSYGGSSNKEIAILRDSREQDDTGRYSFDVETANGIVLEESGTPAAEGAIATSGSYS